MSPASDRFRSASRARDLLAVAFAVLAAASCATGPTVHDVRIDRDGRVGTLPLIEVRPAVDRGELLAVLLTGDGGWRRIDVQVTRGINAGGVPVVGWSLSSYFRQRRTPDEAAADLAALLRQYSLKWGQRDFVLIGYSRGADVLPFMVSRLPDDLRSRVRVLALLGPGFGVNFYLPRLSLLRRRRENDFQIKPEVEKLRGIHILCVEGEREHHSLCPALPAGLAEVALIPGSHHFAGDYARVARLILDAAR
jgi:type IV secretory pathway VirJ component